jgi:hypothetical protein
MRFRRRAATTVRPDSPLPSLGRTAVLRHAERQFGALLANLGQSL